MKNYFVKMNYQYIFLLLLPVTLLAVYFWANPFQTVLVSNTVSLTRLNNVQRANIELASQKLDGSIIALGQTFSFNNVVGPRTAHQGYAKSPSYLEGDTPLTFGGGICLLSSVLYKNALELGLPINERTAHTRTTQCIAPGFDATVWYGKNDLRFTNNLNMPLKIEAKVDSQNLTVKIIGHRSPTITINSLRRIVNRDNKESIEVVVLKEQHNKLAFVSRDRYGLAHSFTEISHNKINN